MSGWQWTYLGPTLNSLSRTSGSMGRDRPGKQPAEVVQQTSQSLDWIIFQFSRTAFKSLRKANLWGLWFKGLKFSSSRFSKSISPSHRTCQYEIPDMATLGHSSPSETGIWYYVLQGPCVQDPASSPGSPPLAQSSSYPWFLLHLPSTPNLHRPWVLPGAFPQSILRSIASLCSDHSLNVTSSPWCFPGCLGSPDCTSQLLFPTGLWCSYCILTFSQGLLL